jgi:hypothetical protein
VARLRENLEDAYREEQPAAAPAPVKCGQALTAPDEQQGARTLAKRELDSLATPKGEYWPADEEDQQNLLHAMVRVVPETRGAPLTACLAQAKLWANPAVPFARFRLTPEPEAKKHRRMTPGALKEWQDQYHSRPQSGNSIPPAVPEQESVLRY